MHSICFYYCRTSRWNLLKKLKKILCGNSVPRNFSSCLQFIVSMKTIVVAL